MVRWFLVLVSLAVTVSCSDDSPQKGTSTNSTTNNTSNNVNSSSNNGSTTGCDAATYCAEVLCGRHFAPGCGEADCGACRYTDRYVGAAALARDPAGKVWLLDIQDQQASLVTPDGLEEVIPQLQDASRPVIAADASGRVHVVAITTELIYGVRATSGTWTFSTVVENDDTDEFLELAVEEDGTPVIFRRSQALVLEVYRQNAELGFDMTPLEGPSVVGSIRASYQNGRRLVAFLGATGVETQAVVYEQSGDTWAYEILPATSRRTASVAVVSTPSGIAAATISGEYTLRVGSALTFFNKEPDGWTVEEHSAGTQNGLALDTDEHGQPVALYSVRQRRSQVNNVVYLTRQGFSPWRVGTECEDGPMDMVVDGDGRPHLLYCGRYRVATERYTDAYFEACQTAAETICESACECNGTECCYQSESGSANGCTFGPGGQGRDICIESFRERLCGSEVGEEQPTFDCASVVQDGLVCIDAAVSVPATCYFESP